FRSNPCNFFRFNSRDPASRDSNDFSKTLLTYLSLYTPQIGDLLAVQRDLFETTSCARHSSCFTSNALATQEKGRYPQVAMHVHRNKWKEGPTPMPDKVKAIVRRVAAV